MAQARRLCSNFRDIDVTPHFAHVKIDRVWQTLLPPHHTSAATFAMEELKDDYREGESLLQYAVVRLTLEVSSNL
jgi:hypothetical protein